MRNLPRILGLTCVALPAALLLCACGGDSGSSSGTPAGTSAPSLPQAGTPNPGTTPATPDAPAPQADAGTDGVQPTDYRPDPTYLPDDSHLGQAS